jgi:hypothetical protein
MGTPCTLGRVTGLIRTPGRIPPRSLTHESVHVVRECDEIGLETEPKEHAMHIWQEAEPLQGGMPSQSKRRGTMSAEPP